MFILMMYFHQFKKTYNQTDTYYDPYGQKNLTLYKKYYWKIVTWDSQEISTVGDDWSFTTGINDEPTDPMINGPNVGTAGLEYEFTFISTDPNNHTIKYYINWDDGNTLETDYFASGKVVNLSHVWDEEGTYIIKIRAEDHLQAQSEWSSFTFKAPRNKALNYYLINYLSEKFPYLFIFLKNFLKLI